MEKSNGKKLSKIRSSYLGEIPEELTEEQRLAILKIYEEAGPLPDKVPVDFLREFLFYGTIDTPKELTNAINKFKMEHEKYYTPALEEFHHGFEYEIFECWDTLPCHQWCKQVFGVDGDNPEGLGYVCDATIANKNIRVKYLDRTDIEDLGFEYDVNMSEKEYDVFAIEPGYDDKNRFIQYELLNYGKGVLYLEKIINSACHEIGFITCKNKSRLKQFLEDLRIITSKEK